MINKKEKCKGFGALSILILIGLLLVLGGGYWYWRTGIKTAPVEGWKIYRNEEYGFEVQYPSTFAFEDKGAVLAREDPPFYSYWISIRARSGRYSEVYPIHEYFELLIYDNVATENYDKFAHDYHGLYDKSSLEAIFITIGDKQLKQITHDRIDDARTMFWIDPSKKRGVVFDITPTDADNLQDFYKIIASLQFIR